MFNKFKKVLVVGAGRLPFDCMRELQKFNITGLVCEYGAYESSQLSMLCQGAGYDYKAVDSHELSLLLDGLCPATLIVSASSIYIFNEKITSRQDLSIINYHPALLPRHPGRNAEAWAIFEQDNETGVTWHEVTSKIDEGNILIAKKIPITDRSTSLSLMTLQIKCAGKLFSKILPPLLEGKLFGQKQRGERTKMHYSYEIPAAGIIDFSWPACKISAFLRCMDYGRLNILGQPLACMDDGYWGWGSYRIVQSEKLQAPKADEFAFCKDGLCFYLSEWHFIGKETVSTCASF